MFYKFPMEQTLKEIGFTKLKMWMQPINFAIEDGKSQMKRVENTAKQYGIEGEKLE